MLALKNAIEALSGHADEFHVDVMDGTCVPDVLFGLDFVEAMRGITETPLDVHLMRLKRGRCRGDCFRGFF